MARPERFELPTPKFVAWCSIQLSYGRIFDVSLLFTTIKVGDIITHFANMSSIFAKILTFYLTNHKMAVTEGFEPSIR